ncbi:NAD+ synthase [Elusimicrobiota bacterium]
MKIALGQINQKAGDLVNNRKKIVNCVRSAKEQNADLVIFPEFAMIGGYCEDLLLNRDFIDKNYENIEIITTRSNLEDMCTLIGTVSNDKFEKDLIINTVSLFTKNTMTVVASKDILDDSDFNDSKYFKKSGFSNVFKIQDKNFACVIADDTGSILKNIEKASWLGVDIIAVFSCSAYYKGKTSEIRNMLKKSATEHNVAIIYINMVGAQDGFVFDGGSMYISKEGKFKAVLKSFEEELFVFDTNGSDIEEKETDLAKEMYDASVLGLKDYCLKNGFKKCVLGVSGGIDSGLTLAIAVDALGRENVLGVTMPSKYTSNETMQYSAEICNRLQVKMYTIPVSDMYDVYLKNFSPIFEGTKNDSTEENLQARIRSNILMSLSNKFGYLPLCTCNKSEDAVGYSTLYGDATGGYSVISDLLKKDVYLLAKYRNTLSEVIPNEIIKRAPTAELRENQKDSDSLPEYDILDDILEKIFDRNMTYKQIVESGVSNVTLDKVSRLIFTSEYKRRQSPLGTKITKTTFIKNIQFPITNGYLWKQQTVGDIDND